MAMRACAQERSRTATCHETLQEAGWEAFRVNGVQIGENAESWVGAVTMIVGTGVRRRIAEAPRTIQRSLRSGVGVQREREAAKRKAQWRLGGYVALL